MITSLQNPLVKQLRKLQRTKERREQQLFLLEGTHLLQEACAVGINFQTVCCTEAWQQQQPHLWDQIQAQTERLETVSPEIVQAIATTVTPDGVVAIVQHHPASPPDFRQLGVVLERIQDPGNLGTIIRTATAAGAEGLLLSADSADLENPKVLRASAGQWFRLPMAVSLDLAGAIGQYKAQGMQVIATVPTATQTYWEVDYHLPSLLLIGNEGAGLSPELVALADRQVTIPLQPGVESLNAAIATALMLYEVHRQRLRSFP